MILCGFEGQAALGDIGNIDTGIHTDDSGVINGNIQGVHKILIPEPLVHNEGISTERHSIYTKARHTSRNTEIVSKRANRPTTFRSSELRNFIFSRGNPCGLGILSIKFSPMAPGKTVRNKEIIGIQIDIVHDGGGKGLHTNHFGSFHFEGITGKNLINIERNHVTDIERQLHGMGAVKSRTGHIDIRRIQRKMRFYISIHIHSPLDLGS